MSLAAIMPLDQVDIGGVSLRPEDLLSDEMVGLMNNLHHNIQVIPEDDPLHQQHMAFRAEIENRPIMLTLDDIKFDDIDDDNTVTNVSLYDTDKMEFENIDGINADWFIGAGILNSANYVVPDAIAELIGRKNDTVKYKNIHGTVEEYVRINQAFIPEEIAKVFNGKVWEVVV